jgi:hypothetical protein
LLTPDGSLKSLDRRPFELEQGAIVVVVVSEGAIVVVPIDVVVVIPVAVVIVDGGGEGVVPVVVFPMS